MATECSNAKIDSNVTGLAFAEEVCLKVLPTVAAGDGGEAVWFGLEPNSYSDMGGEITTVARSPIDPSRQNKKGTVTDLDASGGFNIDVTKSNLVRLLQGFFFADARQGPSTQPLNAAPLPITGVVGAGTEYNAASGLDIFAAGDLVFASGFTIPANNGLKTVVSALATEVVVAETLADETPTAAAKLDKVGRQFASADLSIVVSGGSVSLASAAVDMTTLGFFPGQWLFLGGDNASHRFANNVGYARIGSITEDALFFDDTTFTAVSEVSTGKPIRVYSGLSIKNEQEANLIKRRSYNIERTLGMGPTDVQAEYVIGAVANELTINVPQADKLNADLSFVGCDQEYRTGETGDEIKVGTRVPALGEDAFNTSSDIYRIKMAVIDPASTNPSALFGYVSEANMSINNGVTPNKAVGVLGAFDTSAGNFEVGGSITAYFTTIEAVRAVRANADVGLSMIFAARNAGFIFDIPLLGLGGGRLSVEKDNPITVPLEPAGAQNSKGYTMLYGFFPYLPNVAMPN